tara:strand:- start:8172 stop:9998 length:1827 start_codon:yes stop_codon:yes gene_type:complete
MHINPLVTHLRTYGPLAGSDAIYDEHVVHSASAAKVSMLEVHGAVLDRLVDNFSSPTPITTILTGTAGDGKTWHCRKLFSNLGGDPDEWRTGVGTAALVLPSGKRLVVIKDLSQFAESENLPEMARDLTESMCGRGDIVHLVAANDGQLLRFWRRFEKLSTDASAIEQQIRTMLERGQRSAAAPLLFEMHNLSRQHHDDQFDRLLEAVVGHEAWSRCQGCRLLEEGTCAIRRNRSALADNSSEAVLRYRLKDLIRIAGANDTHLPMRHILLLLTNILLGVSHRKTALLDCAKAHALASEGSAALSNPFENVLGLNLDAGEQSQYVAFSVFANAGLGQETTNAIDAMLIEKRPEAAHAAYVASDDIHGAPLFEPLRNAYRRGILDDYSMFQQATETQRRRLFFVLPSTNAEDEIDAWRLTVFRHGGQYLKFWDALRQKSNALKVKSKLVVGMNRSYSGAMCDNADSIWITGPAANTQSRIGRILEIELPLGEQLGKPLSFDFQCDDDTDGRPIMVVKTRAGYKEPFTVIVKEVLTPLLFEYLMRVEAGSLPGSFSRQCYEELRQFRLRISARLRVEGLLDTDTLAGLKIVRLGGDGMLTSESLGVTTGN